MNVATVKQPRPVPGKVDIATLVKKDIEARVHKGMEKYGRRLASNNGNDPDIHLYQELVDATLYCRQMLLEKEALRSALMRFVHWYTHATISAHHRRQLKPVYEAARSFLNQRPWDRAENEIR